MCRELSYPHDEESLFVQLLVNSKFFPREARLINLLGRAGPSGAKPREFERKIYLYICLYIYLVEGVRNVA